MFRKRRFRKRHPSGSEVYEGLRRQLLEIDPASVGLAPSPELPRVWGALMETGYPAGVSTLVALADGTASLYLSNGGGIIGGGFHPQVEAAARALLAVVERCLDQMPAATATTLPATGRTVFRAMTYQGQHAVEADDDDLHRPEHPQYEMHSAAHAVITELRLIEEARSGDRER